MREMAKGERASASGPGTESAGTILPTGTGHLPLCSGHIASIVTYLEMRSEPPSRRCRPFDGATLRYVANPEPAWYKRLFRMVGQEWLWFSRLLLSEQELATIIQHPFVSVFALEFAGSDAGLLELDRRTLPDIEIAFLGLIPELIGTGTGAWLMAQALQLAWSFHPSRVWLHTCTLDHPNALAFYMRAGFVPYKRSIEIAEDPRLTGILPRSAAPHVPLIADIAP